MIPELIKLLCQSSSCFEDSRKRYISRIDENPHTLSISECDMSLADTVFGRGKIDPPTYLMN